MLICGIGNTFRHDDGVGVWVARQLEEKLADRRPDLVVREMSGEGAGLLDAWKGEEIVFLIDATSSGKPAGSIFRFTPQDEEIPTRFFNYSTHAFSVAEAVELGRALKRLPREMWVFGIEGEDFSAGVGLSAPVHEAAERVVSDIMEQIACMKLA